jgi:hypothetical protein
MADRADEKEVVNADEYAAMRRDKERLDWLSEYVETGCADFGFEFDGGVYLQLIPLGGDKSDFRERNDIRQAIDDAIAAELSKQEGGNV